MPRDFYGNALFTSYKHLKFQVQHDERPWARWRHRLQCKQMKLWKLITRERRICARNPSRYMNRKLRKIEPKVSFFTTQTFGKRDALRRKDYSHSPLKMAKTMQKVKKELKNDTIIPSSDDSAAASPSTFGKQFLKVSKVVCCLTSLEELLRKRIP